MLNTVFLFNLGINSHCLANFLVLIAHLCFLWVSFYLLALFDLRRGGIHNYFLSSFVVVLLLSPSRIHCTLVFFVVVLLTFASFLSLFIRFLFFVGLCLVIFCLLRAEFNWSWGLSLMIDSVAVFGLWKLNEKVGFIVYSLKLMSFCLTAFYFHVQSLYIDL